MANTENKEEIFFGGIPEKEYLLKLLPRLINEHLNELSAEQLRLIHYIIGYYAKIVDNESLLDTFEAYEYNEEEIANILGILSREGFVIINRPY